MDSVKPRDPLLGVPASACGGLLTHINTNRWLRSEFVKVETMAQALERAEVCEPVKDDGNDDV